MTEKLLPKKDEHLGRLLQAIKLSIEDLSAKTVRMELENDCKLIPDRQHCWDIMSVAKQIQEQSELLEQFVGAYYNSSEEEQEWQQKM